MHQFNSEDWNPDSESDFEAIAVDDGNETEDRQKKSLLVLHKRTIGAELDDTNPHSSIDIHSLLLSKLENPQKKIAFYAVSLVIFATPDFRTAIRLYIRMLLLKYGGGTDADKEALAKCYLNATIHLNKYIVIGSLSQQDIEPLRPLNFAVTNFLD